MLVTTQLALQERSPAVYHLEELQINLRVGTEARPAALIERHKLAERVRLLGARPHAELPSLYAAADILVLASSREGWANVLLEAMACGTPVVASNIWGNPEVVRDAAAGMIADENAWKELLRRYAACSRNCLIGRRPEPMPSSSAGMPPPMVSSPYSGHCARAGRPSAVPHSTS
jgi:glycosyltransferase involved in cell wall biosynthesis